MPTYEYQCDQCRRTFEVWQRITADPLTRCETCGGSLRRLLSPAPFILKGDGWYVTDYPSEARKKGMESEKAGAAATTSPEKSSTENSGNGATKSSAASASTTASD